MEGAWSLEEWWYPFNIFQSFFLLVKHGQTIQPPGKPWNGQRKSGSRNHSRIIQRGWTIADQWWSSKSGVYSSIKPPIYSFWGFGLLSTLLLLVGWQPQQTCAASKPGLCSSLAPFRQAPTGFWPLGMRHKLSMWLHPRYSWCSFPITPWKFNIALENIPSEKESSLPTIIFQGLC